MGLFFGEKSAKNGDGCDVFQALISLHPIAEGGPMIPRP